MCDNLNIDMNELSSGQIQARSWQVQYESSYLKIEKKNEVQGVQPNKGMRIIVLKTNPQ